MFESYLQVLESQMTAHDAKVSEAKIMAESFQEAKHFLSEELTQKTQQIVQRFVTMFTSAP